LFCRQKPKSLERVGENLIFIVMKTLTIEEMEENRGGSIRAILLCAGIGAMYSIASPVAGAIATIVCSMSAEKEETGRLRW